MPESEEKVVSEGSSNRISNMPLLIADGYPTSLNKITEEQLEKFIPFMVQCSLGVIQIHSLDEFREPQWWPNDLEFTNPFKRPKSFTGNWLHTMKQIVVECYSFHKCVYLLRYCNDLASYQPTSLRFINNYNSTTSLFERLSNKLLVTFRNENMLYDQEQKINSRKCLLPKQSSSQHNQEEMVSEGFDIYLCDNCDAELYSYGALVDHERDCLKEQSIQAMDDSSDDDDVIFCGEVFDAQLPLGSSARALTEQQKKLFLAQNFTLVCVNGSDTADSNDVASPSKAKGSSADGETAANDPPAVSPGKHRRMPRRTRYVITLAKCPQIPLSSPLGQSLVKSTKAHCTTEYANERLERMDRFCHAPALPPGTGPLIRQQRSGQEPLSALDRRLPKWLYTKPRLSTVPVTYKRPTDEPIEPYHDYKFPRRQFSTKHRLKNFMFYNKPLIQRCKSCSIRLKRLTPSEMRFLIEWPGVERRKREAELAAEQERQRRKEAAARAMIIDSIDLCSSEEEEEEEEEKEEEEEEDPMVDTTEDVTEALEVASTTPSPVLLDGTSEGTVTPTTFSPMEEADTDDGDLETIVLEGDDADVVPISCATFDRQKGASSNGLRRSVGAPMASHPSPFHATLLNERALRLNQSLPTAATGPGVPLGRPMYLYTNCTRTTVSVGGTPGASIADSNRLLKENRVSGWMQNGIAHANVGGNSAPLPVMAQSHTMLLSTPSVRALFPVTFANGSVGVSSHVGGSVVQTLTTTTFANQTVHKRRLSVARTTGASTTVVTGGSAATANLQ